MYLVDWNFRCHACTTKKHAPHDMFFRNHELNHVTEIRLRYLQNMPVYYPSRKYKLSMCSFLAYCYTIVFVHDIVPLKMMLGTWYHMNLTTFHLQQHNLYPSSMKYYFSIDLFLWNVPSVAFKTWLNGSLTDWLSKHS